MTTIAHQQFPDLLAEQRPTVDTATAAHWLSRRPQTMRFWALTGHPIQPRRVNGRLAWPTVEIKRLLGVA
nr:DNA-binding protein [Rhodoferax sp. PAMC 29310]